MYSTHLSRQDTLLSEDPSWSYSQVPGPGQPAPIPPRNEPMLYIPQANITVDDSNVYDIALCLQNLHKVKVHLSTPPANSESINDDGTITRASNTTNAADNSLGKVCVVLGFCYLNSKDFVWPRIMRPSHCRQWLRWLSDMILHHRLLVSISVFSFETTHDNILGDVATSTSPIISPQLGVTFVSEVRCIVFRKN